MGLIGTSWILKCWKFSSMHRRHSSLLIFYLMPSGHIQLNQCHTLKCSQSTHNLHLSKGCCVKGSNVKLTVITIIYAHKWTFMLELKASNGSSTYQKRPPCFFAIRPHGKILFAVKIMNECFEAVFNDRKCVIPNMNFSIAELRIKFIEIVEADFQEYRIIFRARFHLFFGHQFLWRSCEFSRWEICGNC